MLGVYLHVLEVVFHWRASQRILSAEAWIRQNFAPLLINQIDKTNPDLVVQSVEVSNIAWHGRIKLYTSIETVF